MAPRKTATDSVTTEPTRRSSRIADKPKPIAEEKPPAKPRTKKAINANKKREAEENAESGSEKSGLDKRRQAKKVHASDPLNLFLKKRF